MKDNQLIPPKLFQAFLAVNETGSFTLGAKRMNLTQSTISQQINRLESMIGNPLFTRTATRLLLTKDGEQLMYYAKEILALNNQLASMLTHGVVEKEIKIGMPDDLTKQVISTLAKFKDNKNIILSTGLSNDLLSKFENEQLDMIIVKSNELGNPFSFRKEPLFWLDSKESPVFNSDPIHLSVFPEGGLCRDMIFNALDMIGRKWEVRYSSSSIYAVGCAAAYGFGITLLPESCITSDHQIVEELQQLDVPHSLYLSLYLRDDSDIILKQVATKISEMMNLKVLK